jgi:hypothetical protein
MALSATSGTNTAIWTNFGAAVITAIVGLVQPDMLAAILGPKFAIFVPTIILGLNWLAHAFTGNSATSIAPGVGPVVNPGNQVGAAGG